MKQSAREDLKRRAPAAALGLATTRFGDWARSFPGCDRMSQLVPSLWGRVRIAGRATAASRCCGQENVLRLGPIVALAGGRLPQWAPSDSFGARQHPRAGGYRPPAPPESSAVPLARHPEAFREEIVNHALA